MANLQNALASNLQSNLSPSTPITQPQKRWGKSSDRHQAVVIQRRLEATILDPDTPASSVASCAAAWTRVQEAKRIIDGKPLPGQLRPDLEQRKAKRQRPSRAIVSIASADLPAADPSAGTQAS